MTFSLLSGAREDRIFGYSHLEYPMASLPNHFPRCLRTRMPPKRSRSQKTSRRSSLRFPLELPTQVRWVENNQTRTLHTQTKNMSSSGLYLLAEPQDQPGARIEFEVKLPAEIVKGARVVLRGKGHLVRREEMEDNRVGVAAVIDQYQFFPEDSPAGDSTA